MRIKMRLFAFIILCANSFNTFECAKSESGKFGRIARGRCAVLSQFPYTVRMDVNKEDGEYLCGAALIGASWLLTAAHCVHKLTSLRVYLGCISHDTADAVYDVALSDIRIHPLFKWGYMQHDIALIRIPQTMLNKNIAIVPLPKIGPIQNNYVNAYATACGWGFTGASGQISNRLQYGRFQILKAEKCRYLKLPKTEICTAKRSGLASTCLGDSGGPLVLEQTGELVGISSHGIKRKCENQFSVFTRVSSYLYWVEAVSGISYGRTTKYEYNRTKLTTRS